MQPLSASPLRTLHNSNGPKKRILPDPLELQGLTMELAEPTMTAGTTSSSSTAGTMMHSAIRSAAPSPEPQKGLENDHDTIWQVVVGLDRLVLETRKDQRLLAAEIEDLMFTIEDHCLQLGQDPANVSHLMILPNSAPASLTTRLALCRACDDLHKDILRRTERIERWISRIEIISENIRESPGRFLQTTMPPMSRARIMELERTYRSLEKEWAERLKNFQSMVGMLLVRWQQCAYIPVDDYDLALNKLFELAEQRRSTLEFSTMKVEAPLCLSNDCLATLTVKLASLDQNYYTRQARIRAMEHVLGLIYQDIGTPLEKRVPMRNEATVKYAAELGRELKSLQLELLARKQYLSGEHWPALQVVWDACMVGEQERTAFKEAIDHPDVPFTEKVARIQSEIDNCRSRFSKSGQVYKIMMTRSNHIEKMIAFEQTAKDPKRLFQSSFQLNEEEKFRRRAYPTLLKLETTLSDAIEKFEQERGEEFMYEGVRYLETLQAEINHRHVNETVFAKFTPVIAAPTRSQTIQIMGRPISPIPAPASRPTSSVSRLQAPSNRPQDGNRRSLTLPPNSQGNDAQQHLQAFKHQREVSSTSTVSSTSNHTLKSKTSASSLSSVSATSTSVSTAASTTNSPASEQPSPTTSYFNIAAASGSISAVVAEVTKQEPKSLKMDRRSLPTILKTPPGSPAGTIRISTRPSTHSASPSTHAASPSRFAC